MLTVMWPIITVCRLDEWPNLSFLWAKPLDRYSVVLWYRRRVFYYLRKQACDFTISTTFPGHDTATPPVDDEWTLVVVVVRLSVIPSFTIDICNWGRFAVENQSATTRCVATVKCIGRKVLNYWKVDDDWPLHLDKGRISIEISRVYKVTVFWSYPVSFKYSE